MKYTVGQRELNFIMESNDNTLVNIHLSFSTLCYYVFGQWRSFQHYLINIAGTVTLFMNKKTC